jgi:hypothetical protein
MACGKEGLPYGGWFYSAPADVLEFVTKLRLGYASCDRFNAASIV